MIRELTIKNFAIIEAVELSFDNGFTTITGETGAGKSILIDAIGLLIGNRASVHYIRRGENKAIIQGIFTVEDKNEIKDVLEDNDVLFDDEIIITRTLLRSGKSTCKINGTIVPFVVLKEIGNSLVDIHSQFETSSLFDKKHQLNLIDKFGTKLISEIKGKYDETYDKYINAKNRYENLLNQEFNPDLIEIYRFQLDEIEAANLTLDEEDELNIIRKKLVHFEDISNSLNSAIEALDDDGVNKIYDALTSIQNIQEYDSDYSKWAGELNDLYYSLEDILGEIKNKFSSLDFEVNNLNEVEERLFVIQKLKAKYGHSVKEILDKKEELISKLDMIENRKVVLEEYRNTYFNNLDEIKKIGLELSAKRREIASLLEERIIVELNDLYMENVALKLNFQEFDDLTDSITKHGIDSVEFLIATNNGSDMKPLKKIASGGELSRIMLVLKIIFALNENYSTVIFDEIETGVSGKVASAVAEKLRQLSTYMQVFSISHLPQVASFADNHYYVSKFNTEFLTTSTIKLLNYEERINIIASMISSSEVTEEAKLQAKKLIDLTKTA